MEVAKEVVLLISVTEGGRTR